MRTGFILTVALSLLTLLLTTPLQAQDSVAADLDKLIARMPAKSAAEKDAIVAGMLKLGQAGVLELCGRIRTSDEPLDGNVCAALHGLAHAAAKPNAEDARRMVAGVFGDILEGEVSIAAKSFLITELRTVGGAESVGAVSALLKIDALCESAAQTLVSIGTPEAGAALRQGAANVKGKKRAVALFALGRMRDRAAVPLLLKDAAGKDDAVRHAALFALAEIGDPAAEKVLLKAAAANDEGECEKAAHRLLRFALRLAENGHKKNAIRVYRGLLAQKAQAETGIAPGAFYELMRLLEKNEALTGLVVGLGHPSVKVRTAALRVASDLPGSDVTQVLAKALVTLPAERRAPVAELLRQRGDPAALTSVTQALKDPAASVRIAAMAAVGGLGKRDVAPQLMAFLDQTSEEAEAARAALIAMGDKGLNEVLVETLPKATPEARCALLSVLAARDAAGLRDVFLSHTKDPDKNVRRTALKVLGSLDDAHVVRSLMALLAGTESAAERTTVERSLLEACRHLAATSHGAVSKQLIAAYGKADVPVRCALINAVTCLAEGYPAALGYVRAIRKDGDPAVRTAALRALADWPTSEPMEELLKVANDTKAMTDHVLALRGCIRMAGQHAASTNAAAKKKAIGTLKSTLAASRRTEEKRRVLGAVSAIGHPDALGIAVGCLNDDVLRAEATAAVAKIAQAMNRPATVLVAYDKRARTPPAWLKSWTDTGTDLQTTDVPLRVYSNIARKETITLGGNKAPGASSHYAVILTGSVQQAPVIVPAVKEALAAVKDDGLRKQVEGLIAQAEDSGDRASSEQEFHVAKVASGKGCKVVKGGLKNGAKVFIDRTYTFKSVPPELEGATYVMMANNDKNRKDKEYIVLRRGEGPAEGSTSSEPVGKPVRVMLGGKLVTEYHYADADRPYFYPVIAPTGENITRHWPMNDTNKDEQQDHKHHRSVWFTHGAVNGHDFWSEGAGPKVVQTKMVVHEGDSRCVIVAENEWRAGDGKIVCTDVRRHKITTSGDNRTIDFEITLKASHGEVVLGDTKEGSMAMRVAPSLRTKGKVAQGSMVNSEGGSGRGIWGKQARWCDYYGPLNGKTVGIAIMDHPGNPRHPTTWHARDYGLCAANPFGLSYFEKKKKGAGNMAITKGESVTFKYRVLVHNGTAEEAGVEKMYQAYIAKPKLKSIFTGTDFTGWKVPGNNIWWTVHDGMMSVKNGPKKKGSILWTENAYRDFVVDFEFRYGEGTVDSGVFIRTAKQQVQLGISGSLKRDMTGSVYVPGKGYPLEAEGVKELLKPRDWNTMKIQAIGNVYTIWLNRKQVLVYDAKQAIEEGPVGFQLHGGKTMAIDFRNVKLAELN